MEKIHFIGPAKVIKAKLILEYLYNTGFMDRYDIMLITDSTEGETYNFCVKNNINTMVVDKKNLLLYEEKLRSFEAEFLVSIGWDSKIPLEILYCYKFPPINCHSSVLPDYRGKRVYMAIYANIEDYYGATIHYMNEKFDDGNIVSQCKIKLFLNETPEIIHRRICELTAIMLPDAIKKVEEGFIGVRQSGTARYFLELDRMEMDNLRMKNVENIRKGKEKAVSKHKVINIE